MKSEDHPIGHKVQHQITRHKKEKEKKKRKRKKEKKRIEKIKENEPSQDKN